VAETTRIHLCNSKSLFLEIGLVANPHLCLGVRIALPPSGILPRMEVASLNIMFISSIATRTGLW
jgi:hypothetical protein